MRKNIILTGLPHSGKSTLLLNLLKKIHYRENALITKEILEEDKRVGFIIQIPIPFDSINSTNSVIAHVDFSKKNQVGKYGVNVGEIDFWASKYLDYLDKISRDYSGEFSTSVNFLDEVGQMQLFSKVFKTLIQEILFSDKTSILTLSSVYNDVFTDVIRKRRDIILLEVTPENRNELLAFVPILVQKIEKAKGYIFEPDRFKQIDDWIEMESTHGKRKVDLHNKTCTCNFFSQYKKYKFCSHILACEEFFSFRN